MAKIVLLIIPIPLKTTPLGILSLISNEYQLLKSIKLKFERVEPVFNPCEVAIKILSPLKIEL